MLSEKEIKTLDEILERFGHDATRVIGIMQEIQKVYRYLPEESLSYISKDLGISEAKIFGVATFYENFSLEPKGKYVIKVCDGTACHVRNSVPILEEFRKELGLSDKKKTTDDRMFTVETVSCLGACGLAPVCTVNDTVHPAMTPAKVKEIIDELKSKEVEA
ncbi:NADH-quinone oxidoreductase subunit E [Lachnospiraceae bacterium YSD2013]|jgi:NADH-quinone oxidoreductase subunit E|nr:NAD(P)H-dependent oxidoreductase subunit E [Lachnospiraceae bacterium]SCX13050.1 NADH-quinone oxidoreductase subunit E [Lachnospiraceae bacterium YSD2013]MBO4617552.1 NAD(P)H-dependent oxidoreductase subunit E [Lachnospiraceae bacterium]MBO4824964.1 NAD(P)H-dependent oxidoreductase subunit E [Lachnospiraceae bacterium]MBR5761539.1 NAD(P)H-dependent oxidoreductase subunit E [Lachnospiraceae bacterium]